MAICRKPFHSCDSGVEAVSLRVEFGKSLVNVHAYPRYVFDFGAVTLSNERFGT